jgi:hypothetical protein
MTKILAVNTKYMICEKQPSLQLKMESAVLRYSKVQLNSHDNTLLSIDKHPSLRLINVSHTNSLMNDTTLQLFA